MRYEIECIDSHTAGEPCRIIIGGPRLKGSTMWEKQLYMQENFDFIRSSVMLEPRGHADMFGAVLTEPCDREADFGILFINGGGYDNMCGHGSIACACVAVDAGLVKVSEPVTTVKIETVAGIVTVEVEVENGRSKAATFRGIPSFCYKPDIELNVFGNKIKVDLSYGGNFFGIVDMKQLGLKHTIKDIDGFIKYGTEIRRQLNEDFEFSHPEHEYINWVNDILFTGNPEFEGDTYKSLCFLGEAQLDRSPCGTGTSARMGTLYNKGLLKHGEKFMHESIIGTVFEGSLGEELKVGDFQAIVPVIKSRGYLIGHAVFVIDDEDPVKYGFLLR